MVRYGYNVVCILNFITFLLSIPIVIGGVWLSRQGIYECQHFLDKPVILLGFFLMVISLAGFFGVCCRESWLLWVYLLEMFLLIVLLFCFTIFLLAVTSKGAGEAISGKGYKEYRLGDYSSWLRKRVNSDKNWNKIKSCLQDSKVCKSMIDDGSNTPVNEFYNRHLSAIQSGCCKPSNDCGFTYVTPITWTKNDTTTPTNPDCNAWNNDQNILCYNCQSCKAGLLDNIKTDWKNVAILNVMCLVGLIIVYSMGCSAFRNNRQDNITYAIIHVCFACILLSISLLLLFLFRRK